MADNQTKKYLDILTAFPSGINSGVAPILLPKDQASFAINTTFRGGYATDRAPVQKLTLNFGGDAELETAFRTGFFQGASPVPYRPDFGPSQHIVQISGRLFAVTENGSVWDVTEITVPGDPNDATTSQVWMWQAEKWMIISDGSARFPVFYDGVSSRRSNGPSSVLGSVTAATPAGINPIGTFITATMADNYAGPFNVAVRFNGAYYQTSPTPLATPGYPIVLKNQTGNPGATIPAGTPVIVKGIPSTSTPRIVTSTDLAPLNVFASAVGQPCCGISNCLNTPCALTNVWQIPFGTEITVTLDNDLPDATTQVNLNCQQSWTFDRTPVGGGLTTTTTYGISYIKSYWNVVSISADRRTIVLRLYGFYSTNPANTAGQFIREGSGDAGGIDYVYYNSTRLTLVPGQVVASGIVTPPDVPLGNLASDYTIPAVGASSTANLDVVFSGPDNLLVESNGQQFYASVAPIPTPSTTIYLININDTAAIPAAGPPGFPQDITSIPEIPACRMGAYGLGQSWFSFTDGLGFGASDAVGAYSGTQAYSYRDAVLKTSDLEIMGGFRIPNAGEIITSMTFVATLDAALGQGPLQIGVSSGMFSVKAPFTLLDFQGLTNAVSGDLVTAPITNPILTKSLLGFGPIAQNSTVVANSDTIFRSFEGVNSLILARRNFSDIGGNTPISREMARAIDLDNKSLLSYSSAIVFDNRLRMTCSPQVSERGVFHMGELVLNYDLISSLRGKAPPVWEGLWTGTNVLQYSQGLFGAVSRAFAFTFNITDEQIELYELLPTGTEHFDNGTTRIRWIVETPVLFNAQVKNLTDVARMMDGEMYLSDINGQVDVVVLYRPVFYPCWRPWHTFSVCSDMSADNAKEQTIHPLGFGEPDPRDCDPINNQSFRQGVGFQLRLEFTGHCKLWGVRVLGHQVPTDAFAKPAGC